MTNELVSQSPRLFECTIDVRFEELSRDPIAVCRKIAKRAGMEHTEKVEETSTEDVSD